MNKEFIHLWPCAMLTAGFMLAFKCMSADQARDSVEWSVYICEWRVWRSSAVSPAGLLVCGACAAVLQSAPPLC
jgi:hypothetical protein